MKPTPGVRPAKYGERTGTICPVCGDAVLRQEKFDRAGALDGHLLVCSKRGCPWQARQR